MTGYERIAKSAGRRMVLNEFQQHASRYLLLGLGLSLLLVVLDRLLNLQFNPILIGAAPPTAALALACLNAWTHRPTPLQALAHVDGVLRLHDTLGTASAVGAMPSDRPVPPTVQAMRELTNRRAEELAATVPVRRAIPLRSTQRWWVTGLFAVVVAAALFFLPTFDLLAAEPSEEDTRSQARSVEQRAQATEAVQSMQEALEETAAVNDDPLLQEQLERLDRLDQELATARNSDSLLKKTAGEFHDLADSLDERADESRRRFAQESQRFERLPQPERQEARDLAEALQREDMQRAIETLREMERSLNELPQAEREQLAEDLRTLANHLNEPAGMSAPAEEAQTPRDAAAEYLREQGLSEPDAAEIADLPDEESMQQALEDRGFDPMTADRLAEQAMEEREQREAEDAADESMRDLAEALNETADEVENPPEPGSQESASEDPAEPPDASPPLDDQAETPGEEQQQPTDQEQPAEGAGEQQDPDSTQPGDSQPTDRMEGQDLGAEGEERLGDQGEESTPGEGEDAQPDSTSTADAQPGDQEGDAAKTGDATANPPTDPQTGEQGSQDPTGDEREGADPGQEADDDPQPGADGEQDETETTEPGEGVPPPDEKPPTEDTADPDEQPGGEATPPEAGSEDSPPDQGPGDQPPGGEAPPDPPDDADGTTSVEPDPTPGEEPGGPKGSGQPGESTPPPTDTGSDAPGETSTPGQGDGQNQPGDPSVPNDPDAPGGDGLSPGSGADQTPDATGTDRLIDELERLQNEREEAEKQQEISKEARSRAEQLMNSLSPEERERLLQWAQQYRNQDKLTGQPAAARTDVETEALDIRRSGEEDRVAAEWDRDPEPGEGISTRPVTGAPTTADQIKQAQRAADRAIEEQAFPSRFSNIVRKYFQRARESAEKAEKTAQDAAENSTENAGSATESSESSGSE